MAVLNRSQLKPPTLAAETVNVPELGGEIVVQAMMMSDRLQIATEDLPKFAHDHQSANHLLARS